MTSPKIKQSEKTSEKSKHSKNDRDKISQSEFRLKMQNETLMQENARLRAVQADLNQRLFRQREEITSAVIEEDLKQRAHDGLVLELLQHSERYKARAVNEAQNCAIKGFNRDEMPSSITVQLRIAQGIRELADRLIGHQTELRVKS